MVLDDNRALAIIVGSDGSVENRVIELSSGFPASALTEASNYINAHFSGYSFSEAKKRLFSQIDLERSELDSAASDLIKRGLAVWSEDSRKRPVLIVRGQSHLLQDASEDLDRAKQLLEELEDKKEIAGLLEKFPKAMRHKFLSVPKISCFRFPVLPLSPLPITGKTGIWSG